MSESFKEESKRGWHTSDKASPSTDQLKLGCLQRIADATEVMARNHNALLADVKFYKEKSERLQKQADKWWRSSCARAGVIKRLKGKTK